ncbi:MAG: hypothetical protein L3J53_04430 [Proteobacteria bacterium]|nr:hypothetical protein [Pseudomonadota bacterium]
MQNKQQLQQRIKYLQKILIQMSFMDDNDDRPELYLSVLKSLHTTQQLLLQNIKMQKGEY